MRKCIQFHSNLIQVLEGKHPIKTSRYDFMGTIIEVD